MCTPCPLPWPSPARLRHLLLAMALLLVGVPGPSLAQTTELNHANLAELEQVKGIGPQLAQRLLDERRAGGPYRSWQDLRSRVKGVGPVTARRLSEAGLRVAGQLPASASASAPGAATSAPSAPGP